MYICLHSVHSIPTITHNCRVHFSGSSWLHCSCFFFFFLFATKSQSCVGRSPQTIMVIRPSSQWVSKTCIHSILYRESTAWCRSERWWLGRSLNETCYAADCPLVCLSVCLSVSMYVSVCVSVCVKDCPLVLRTSASRIGFWRGHPLTWLGRFYHPPSLRRYYHKLDPDSWTLLGRLSCQTPMFWDRVLTISVRRWVSITPMFWYSAADDLVVKLSRPRYKLTVVRFSSDVIG